MWVLAQAKNGDEQFWKEKFHAANGKAQHALKVPQFFFLLSFGLWGGFFSFFLCSLQVPNGFPICSPRVFSIAPRFNLICFAQSPSLLTYIGGPKGEALDLCIESSILGSLHSFNFFWTWTNQIDSLPPKKKKVGLMRHPQLINMKQNKYPNYIE